MWVRRDRLSEEFQSHRLFTAENCFNGVIIDIALVVGVAQSPAKLVVVRERFEFVLKCVDEKPGPRDVENFNDAIRALDERLRGVEVDTGFLFGHHSMCRVYTYLVSSPFNQLDRVWP